MTDSSDSTPLMRLSDAVAAFQLWERGELTREELLDRHASLRDLLEPMLDEEAEDASPSADETGASGSDVRDGGRFLGPYRLRREIGRGGMGIVYEAHDTSLQRTVALKVLPPQLSPGPRQIERFRREAAAAARLDHDGIVPIYSVGEAEGSHYFAMELVVGPSVHAVLERLRHEGDFTDGFGNAEITPDFTGAYPAQVAALVAQAAEAISFAHAAGVIHRDIKPHNLLIGAEAKVRVVDFGLAKDLDRASISQSVEVAGTPSYMSPEQLRGMRDVSEATDVYALGVVLYELLTLRCPFEADSIHELMLAVSVGVPTPMRDFNPKVPRELELVCGKAIEHGVDRRYASAAELAEDLRRFLRHEPVAAKAPSTATRLFKFARRRRGLVASLALILLTLVSGAVFYFGVHRPRSQALERRTAELAEQKKGAARARKAAYDAVRSLVSRAEELEEKSGNLEEIREILKKVRGYLVEIQGNHPERALYATKLITVYSSLSVLAGHSGQAKESIDYAKAAVEIAERMHDERPENFDAVTCLAAMRQQLGHSLGFVGRDAEGVKLLQSALATQRKQLLGTLTDPQREVVKKAVIQTLSSLGAASVKDVAQWGAGIGYFEEALERLKEVQSGDGFDLVAKRISVRRMLGVLLMKKEDLAGAQSQFQHVRKDFEALEDPAKRRKSLRQALLASRELATMTFRADKKRGLALSKNVVALAREQCESESAQIALRLDLMRALRDYGTSLADANQNAAALAQLREAVDIADELEPHLDGKTHSFIRATTYGSFAGVASARSKDPKILDAARVAFGKALRIIDRIALGSQDPTHHYRLAITRVGLAVLDWKYAKDEPVARRGFHSAIVAYDKALQLSPKHPRYTLFRDRCLGLLASFETGQGNWSAAVGSIERLVRADQRNAGMLLIGARLLTGVAKVILKDAQLGSAEKKEAVGQVYTKTVDAVVRLRGRSFQYAVKAPEFAPVRATAAWKKMLEARK